MSLVEITYFSKLIQYINVILYLFSFSNLIFLI